MENKQNTTKQSSQLGEFMRIQDLFYLCLSKWYWFIISMIIALGLACLYIMKTPPVYTRVATLLFKDEYSGESNLSAEISTSFATMGLANQRTNVFNEMVALQSPSLMIDVAKRLQLNMSYTVEGRFYNRPLYGKSLPVSVSLVDIPDEVGAGLTVKILSAKDVELSAFYKDEDVYEKTIKTTLGVATQTPIGKVIVTPTAAFTAEDQEPILVGKTSIYNAGVGLLGGLSVELNDDMSAVVKMTYHDTCPERAVDIMNTLIQVYNEKWIEDKNQVAVSTSAFINDRLAVIEKELGNVDENISSYKSSQLLPDVQAASGLYMSQSSQNDAQLLTLNTQLSIAQYVAGFVNSHTDNKQLLPANAGVNNQAVESQINSYNTLLLQRNSLVANSSEKNPVAADMDNQLSSMRAAISQSLSNYIVSLKTQIASFERSQRETTKKIAANPEQAKHLLSVERQQKVKESLYLFLLQKREENELSQAYSSNKTRVIMQPFGSSTPTTPVRRNIYMIAIVLGLFIPLLVLFIIENMNDKVRGRADLESLTIPFVGEIPMAFKKRSRFRLPSFFGLRHKGETPNVGIVVKEKNRNVINEAFRVVRTNLEFMVAESDGAKVVMLTSANPGSGKTFISSNIAMSLAIKGKRVLAIDLDMRKASLSKVFDAPERGISGYLIGKLSYDEIIMRGVQNPNLDVIPVGKIPPNPTELLFDSRFEELMKRVRQEYDYVFIDCPPIEIVADSQIINRFVDNTLFVVRAELLERSMLPTIEKLYTDKKYRNLGLVLNGTYQAHTGKYGYSYRYGYNYGYGYGYDYNEK
ncbi:MAG: polysaccharide biosynthesis tyrosine autokinase [Bacteroidales bacterium]|nr:polysaccharide biosynthesis tyrosine autokinase [Bacteroidales bacterium]MDD6669397.1 polysaccharide biosynthesis tyrosine autokinase [Bacteroidales bacterium]